MSDEERARQLLARAADSAEDQDLLPAVRQAAVRRRRQRRTGVALLCLLLLGGAVGGSTTLAGHRAPVQPVTLEPAPSGGPVPAPSPSGGPVSAPSLGAPQATALPAAARGRFLVGSAAFSTAATGWVVGARCTGTTCSTVVERSTDGGASFAPVGRLGFDLTPSDVVARVVSLVAADDHDLLVVEQGVTTAVEISHDGGVTWSPLALPGGPLAVVNPAGGAGRFWLAAVPAPLTDASRTHLLLVAAGTGSVTPVATAPDNYGTVAVEGGTAYLTGPDRRLVVARPGSVITRALPGCGHVQPGAGLLLLSCQTGAAAGSGPKQAWSSADDGRTWTRRADPPFGGDLGGLLPLTSRRWLLGTAGGASSLLLTVDGGVSYRSVLSFGDGGAGLTDLAFTDPLHGVVVHGRPDLSSGDVAHRDFGLYVTADGGSSWHQAPITGG